ncbi:MAG: lipoate--protein ligase family protein [Candidatus Methanoperedens sp.]|nr:lipoate--protein ligase family protein [Candidatus Methanoperedens sp.]
MNPKWRFIDSGSIDGVYSAALFESIGRHVGAGKVTETILFWRVSSPVIYLGYHQLVCEEINADFCSLNNIRIVRRILGGGCGFCDGEQILYSVIGREDGIIPRDIQAAYRKVLGGVVEALSTLGSEGEIEPARNAVYSKGRKISGNAQGRFNGAVLINGSLLIDFNFGLMDKVLKNPTKNLKPVASSREGMITLKEQGINDSETIIRALRQGFEESMGISLFDGTLTESEAALANRLLDKYEQKEWTYRMDIKHRLRKGDFL